MTVRSLYGKLQKVWLTIATTKVITFAPLSQLPPGTLTHNYEQLLLRAGPGEGNLCEGHDGLVQVGLLLVHHDVPWYTGRHSSLMTAVDDMI